MYNIYLLTNVFLVIPKLKPSCKKYPSLAIITLAWFCIKSSTNHASLSLKMKLFLQDIKILARTLQKIIRKFSCKTLIRSCKILARSFIPYKKSFIFNARFNGRSCKSCKKSTCKTWIFLTRHLLLGIHGFFLAKCIILNLSSSADAAHMPNEYSTCQYYCLILLPFHSSWHG